MAGRATAARATAARQAAGGRPRAPQARPPRGRLGLLDVGGDAGVAHEPGWSPADDANLAPTDTNLTSCGATSTWTAAPGTGEDKPINCVNWAEAYAFCIWDGGFLPSEAEWEYAASGGGRALAFPWGATAPGTTNQYAIYDCHFPTGSTSCSSAANIAPVGSAPMGAGRFGQLDLAGNESTWNLDFYATAYVSPLRRLLARVDRLVAHRPRRRLRRRRRAPPAHLPRRQRTHAAQRLHRNPLRPRSVGYGDARRTSTPAATRVARMSRTSWNLRRRSQASAASARSSSRAAICASTSRATPGRLHSPPR